MTNTWKVSGYCGWSDYDGPADNNLNFEIEMDKSVTKDELETLLFNRFGKKYRCVVLNCVKI